MPVLPSTLIQANCKLSPVKRCCLNIVLHLDVVETVMLLLSHGMVAFWRLSYEIHIKLIVHTKNSLIEYCQLLQAHRTDVGTETQ